MWEIRSKCDDEEENKDYSFDKMQDDGEFRYDCFETKSGQIGAAIVTELAGGVPKNMHGNKYGIVGSYWIT